MKNDFHTRDFSNLTFDEYIEKHTKTSTFVVIRKDSVVYERYIDDYEGSTQFPSYSISKGFISALTRILIEEGVISSIHDPVVNYIEELRDKGSYWDQLTIAHLLNMESGLEFQEVGNIRLPYFGLANLYLSNNAIRTIQKAEFVRQPGSEYNYSSLDNQMLGILLERASGKPVIELMEEKIWTQIGMQADARWSYDSNKHKNVRTYCCIKATALDLARFGRLYLNKGNWNGQQIVPEEWAKESTTKTRLTGRYHYQWMFRRANKSFFIEGLYGQFLYIIPKSETIFVRLGGENDAYYKSIFEDINLRLNGLESLKNGRYSLVNNN